MKALHTYLYRIFPWFYDTSIMFLFIFCLYTEEISKVLWYLKCIQFKLPPLRKGLQNKYLTHSTWLISLLGEELSYPNTYCSPLPSIFLYTKGCQSTSYVRSLHIFVLEHSHNHSVTLFMTTFVLQQPSWITARDHINLQSLVYPLASYRKKFANSCPT